MCLCRLGCLSATVLYLCFVLRYGGRVANAPFLACLSSACSGVWPFRIRCQRASVLCLRRLRCLSATVLYLCFFYGFEAAVSAPCGRVANAPFLACLFSGLCFACLRHEHGLESCCCSGSSHGLLHGILLGMNPAGFGPRLAARVLATRNVLWIPKITGSIFSALCFPCLGHESCCCSRLSEASHKLLHGIRRCGILVSCFMASKGNGKHFCWLVFCMPWARSLLLFEAFGSFA